MRYLTAADIIKNTGIEVIWIEKDILRKAHIFQDVHYIRMEQ